jgi:hypothetical protein
MMMDFANVMPSLGSWFIVGVMAVTFISFFKFLTAQLQIPGLSDLMASI